MQPTPFGWYDFVSDLPEPISTALTLGGPITLVLAVLSVVSLTIIVFKGVQFTLLFGRGRRHAVHALDAWRAGDIRSSLQAISRAPTSIATSAGTAMRGLQSSGVDENLLREEVQRIAVKELRKVRSHLRTLEVIGAISPLLGLFGTVLGMIEAFRQMEQVGSQVDPSILSGGIWQALLTTGVGLAVAIPTVLAHQWLDKRADTHRHVIEDTITQVFTARIRNTARDATHAH